MFDPRTLAWLPRPNVSRRAASDAISARSQECPGVVRDIQRAQIAVSKAAVGGICRHRVLLLDLTSWGEDDDARAGATLRPPRRASSQYLGEQWLPKQEPNRLPWTYA